MAGACSARNGGPKRPAGGLLERYTIDKLCDPRTYAVVLVVGTLINAYAYVVVPCARGDGVLASFLALLDRSASTVILSIALAYAFPLGVSVYAAVTTRLTHRRADDADSAFPEQNPSPVMLLDAAGTVLYANSPSRPLLDCWGCEVGERGPSPLREVVEQVARSGDGVEYDTVCGERIYAVVLVPIDGGRLFNLYARDVTERREAQRRIDDLARFPEEYPHPILRVTAAGRVEYANEASAPLLDAWQSEVGQPLPDPVARAIAAAAASGVAGELQQEAGGETFAVVLAPVARRGCVNLYAHDITAREKRLRRVTTRLEEELSVAANLQTSILPRVPSAPDYLEVAAAMLPATEVGGDYYDVVPAGGSCWIGIGDAAGHGLNAGLSALMVQSVVAAMVRHDGAALPSRVVGVLNEVLYENLRRRIGRDDFVTFTLLRFDPDGRVRYAGAHEELLVYRAQDDRCESLPTPGTWLGILPDVRDATTDSSLRLDDGDVVVLFSDGVTEAMDGRGEQYGMERLAALVAELGAEPAQEIRDAILARVQAWSASREDDVTVLVVRHRGVREPARSYACVPGE